MTTTLPPPPTGPASIPTATPPNAPKDRFVGHANIMSALTIVSRVFGLLRDKVCATYLGNSTPEWSAFWMGFQLPNLSRRIFGEGALTAIFVPTYTRILHEKGPAEANRLASATVTLLVLFLGGLTVIGELCMFPLALSTSISPANRLAALMVAIMLPYCVMICLVALLSAIATVHEKFFSQALSPIILNLVMTLAVVLPLAFWVTKDLSERVTMVAISVLLAGLLQVIQLLPEMWRSGVSLRPTLNWRDSGIREIVHAMLPMMLGLSAVQLNTYMDTQIAWWLSPDGHARSTTVVAMGHLWTLPLQSGAVGVLSVAQRIYLLPVGIFGVSMATAIFPLLARAASKNDMPELKRMLTAGLRKTLFLSLPASLGMMFVARPLIATLYSSNIVDRAAGATVWFCAGIWAFEAQMVILRAYYALNDRLTPVKVAVSMVGLNFALNVISVWYLQEGGIALSTTLSAIVQSGVLLLILRNRLGPLGLGSLRNTVFKGLAACAGMIIVLLLLRPLLPVMHGGKAERTHDVLLSALFTLPVMVLTAGGTYLLMALLLRMPEAREMPVVGRVIRKWIPAT